MGTTRELRNELYEKYRDAILKVSEKNDTDISVSFDILLHEYFAVKCLRGRTHKYDGVPEDFDWDKFGADIQPLLERE